jgi:hypothetical protein
VAGEERRSPSHFRPQEVKSPELGAAMSLGRLWQHQGEQSEARTMLAPIYGWCTEGFDTGHLRPLTQHPACPQGQATKRWGRWGVALASAGSSMKAAGGTGGAHAAGGNSRMNFLNSLLNSRHAVNRLEDNNGKVLM